MVASVCRIMSQVDESDVEAMWRQTLVQGFVAQGDCGGRSGVARTHGLPAPGRSVTLSS